MAYKELEIDTSEFEGFAQLLEKFPLQVQDKMLSEATGAGASVLQIAMVGAAPVRIEGGGPKSDALPHGYLKADIRVQRLKSGPRGWLIGPGRRTAYVARWLEWGHALVKGGKKGKHIIGHVLPHPFIRPAFDAGWKDAVHAISVELGSRIADYWKQTVSRVKKAA